jgi:hypothetical protein
MATAERAFESPPHCRRDRFICSALQAGVEPVARRDADGRLAPMRRAADAAYAGDLTLPRLPAGGAGGYGAPQHETTYGPVTGHSGPTHGVGALAAQYSHNVHAESQQYARYGPKTSAVVCRDRRMRSIRIGTLQWVAQQATRPHTLVERTVLRRTRMRICRAPPRSRRSSYAGATAEACRMHTTGQGL